MNFEIRDPCVYPCSQHPNPEPIVHWRRATWPPLAGALRLAADVRRPNTGVGVSNLEVCTVLGFDTKNAAILLFPKPL